MELAEIHDSSIGILLTWLSAVGIKLLWCFGIIFFCWIFIRFSSKSMGKFYMKQVNKQRLSMTERKAETLNSITHSVLKYVVYFIGICAVLLQLGVSNSSLLVVASAGSVAVGLGAQSIVTDMIEGFFILFEDCYAVGDIVTINSITGTVEGVTLRSTKIRDPFGSVHIIPNGSVGTVTNLCMEYRNAVVDIGVSYGENINRVLEILEDEMINALEDIPEILELPKVQGVISLDDSAVTIRIVAKCKIKTHFPVGNKLRLRIKNRFDKEGVEIPFPQRVVHIVQD